MDGIEKLIADLKRPDHLVRMHAAFELTILRNERAIPELIRIIYMMDCVGNFLAYQEKHREQAMNCLAKIGTWRCVKILLHQFQLALYNNRDLARNAFSHLYNPKAIPELIKGLKSLHYGVR